MRAMPVAQRREHFARYSAERNLSAECDTSRRENFIYRICASTLGPTCAVLCAVQHSFEFARSRIIEWSNVVSRNDGNDVRIVARNIGDSPHFVSAEHCRDDLHARRRGVPPRCRRP
jgi:hypothetical protein